MKKALLLLSFGLLLLLPRPSDTTYAKDAPVVTGEIHHVKNILLTDDGRNTSSGWLRFLVWADNDKGTFSLPIFIETSIRPIIYYDAPVGDTWIRYDNPFHVDTERLYYEVRYFSIHTQRGMRLGGGGSTYTTQDGKFPKKVPSTITPIPIGN